MYNIVTKLDRPSQCFVVQDKQKMGKVSKEGMLDSGANMGLTSYEVAQTYQRSIHPFKQPLTILGVGDVVIFSYHFADFGPILGVLALLHGGATIISVSHLTKRGFAVVFTATEVKVASTHDGTVLAGRYDDEAGLFYIDIGRLLAYSEGKAERICESESEEREDEDRSHHDGQAAGALQVNVVRSAVEPLKRKSQSKRGAVIPKWLQEATFQLHYRLGHPSARAMALAVSQHAWMGVHPDITAAVIDKVFEKRTCLACALGKMRHLTTPEGSGVRETVPGRTLSYDILGKISPPTYNGGCFVHSFVCEAVGFVMEYITRNKNQYTAEACLRATRQKFAQWGHTVQQLKFDRGSAENSKHLAGVMAELGIAQCPIAFDTQRQNTIERYVQTAYRRVGAIMLNQSTIPAEGWGHAFDLEAATVNCTPNSLTGSDTPYYLITGKRPDVSRLFKHPFGQLLSCYDSEQKSFATGVLAISLGMGAGNGATNVLICGRGLRKFERYDVVPVEVNFLPATSEEIRALQPTVQEDGTAEFFSKAKVELDQSFVSSFPKAGAGAPNARDTSDALDVSRSESAGGGRTQAPAMKLLNATQEVLQVA